MHRPAATPATIQDLKFDNMPQASQSNLGNFVQITRDLRHGVVPDITLDRLAWVRLGSFTLVLTQYLFRIVAKLFTLPVTFLRQLWLPIAENMA
jgi:hypothetical protein